MMNPNELKVLKQKSPLPVLASLLIFFGSSMLIEPEFQQIRKNENRFDSQIQSFASSRKAENEYLTLNNKIVKLKEIKSEALKYLPKKSDLAYIMDQIAGFAENNNVSMMSVVYSFEQEFESMSVPAHLTRIELHGDYSDIRGFIADIESLESPVLISEIVLIQGSRYDITLRLLVK